MGYFVTVRHSCLTFVFDFLLPQTLVRTPKRVGRDPRRQSFVLVLMRYFKEGTERERVLIFGR